ncbi:molecular chaperone [Burkholderia ubonensis]|uniref:Molecular chaperone EcpD n=1 Tax=Burkholderia ubonensis TaxID=101571 RepID=A0AAW3MNF7_9BURK|nr:fimbria/pilus periplasmic chaperone [Burkholderia ubonensis]KVL24394.1 molecular chaperone EcpD [Burkholderia ubonensis]KVN70751.1 molecular chaperone EcpD [Burkholderia ubonensis]KVO43097.1 molecular chaperone EcpD [Burkholderia ubonensis]KVP89798.1 molecular chaperone EcpD [Burkholderia ubonensis]KVQ37671.1 molecular chaperone EcpD [Burkholderia ubonensis]
MNRRKNWRIGATGAMLAASLLGPAAADASVVISGTRVVYPEKEREVTVKLTNDGDRPSLVQGWVDDGNANALPDDTKVPFTVTPPLFRLDPKKGQSLRLIYTQEPLAQDRETLYWLNVLDVPPQVADNPDAPNLLQLAFRSRIKLFFRPASLQGVADESAEKVSWNFAPKPGGGYVLEANNPTPYHVTFSKLAVKAGSASWTNDQGGMVNPKSTAQFDVGNVPSAPTGPIQVDYTFLNDYGASVEGRYAPKPTR